MYTLDCPRDPNLKGLICNVTGHGDMFSILHEVSLKVGISRGKKTVDFWQLRIETVPSWEVTCPTYGILVPGEYLKNEVLGYSITFMTAKRLLVLNGVMYITPTNGRKNG